MIPVVFRSAARRDYVAAVEWYEQRRAGLGAELVREVSRALATAREFPERLPLVESGIRRIKIHRFPFHIYYRCRGGLLVVLAVFHVRRNPTELEKPI